MDKPMGLRQELHSTRVQHEDVETAVQRKGEDSWKENYQTSWRVWILVAKLSPSFWMFHDVPISVPDLWGIAPIHAPNQGKSAESCRNWSSNKEPPISRWKDWDVALRCESPKFPCLIITGSPLRKPFWNKFHFERISRENHIDVIWQYMTTI